MYGSQWSGRGSAGRDVAGACHHMVAPSTSTCIPRGQHPAALSPQSQYLAVDPIHTRICNFAPPAHRCTPCPVLSLPHTCTASPAPCSGCSLHPNPPPPPENPTVVYSLTPSGYHLQKLAPTLNPTNFDKHAAYHFSLAFHCVINIGV